MTGSSVITSAARRYGSELLIVFVGVFAAFQVDNYREQQLRDARTAQIIETLRADLDDYVQVGIRYNEVIASGIADWQSSYQSGNQPAPFVLRISRSEEPPIAVWQAISNSSLVDLLDPNLLFDLGFYYSEVEGVGRKYVRYAEFTDANVMPGLKRDASWFYDETGKLKPEFAAHMDRLQDYRTDTTVMIDWANCLIDRLDKLGTETDECRRAIGQAQ